MTKKQRKTATLRFVNKVRKALRKLPLRQLLKGLPSDQHECALARSIEDPEVTVYDDEDDVMMSFGENQVKAYVVSIALGFDDLLELKETQATAMELEPEVARFSREFDKGLYPELVDISSLLVDEW